MAKRNNIVLACLLLFSCASATNYYGIEWPESGLIDDAVLFVPKGSNAKKDLPMTTCKPDETVNGKCVVQLTEDFFNREREVEELKIRVAELERELRSCHR